MQRGDPKVWSIRTSKGCFHAEKLKVEVPLETVFRPESRNNPRAFFKGVGNGYWVWPGDEKVPILLITDKPPIGHKAVIE